MNSLLFYVFIPLPFAVALIYFVKNKKIALGLSTIPGIFGMFFYVQFLFERSTCGPEDFCEIGMLLVVSYMFFIFTGLLVLTILIVDKIRLNSDK